MPESVRPLIRASLCSGVLETCDEIGDRGDAGIERAQRADQVADIGVLRTIVIGGGAGNVAEIV